MAISDEEAMRRLRSTDPTQWLAPNSEFAELARAASRNLFSQLKPYARKSPLDKLLTEGFDAEQIWHQIEVQSKHLIPSLRCELKRLEKNPEDIKKLKIHDEEEDENVDMDDDELDEDEIDEDEENDENVDMDDDELDEDEIDEDEENDEEGTENEKDDAEEEGVDYDSGAEFEDQFLKIKDLEEFMDDDEAREFALEKKDEKAKKNKVHKQEETEESDGEESDEADEEEEELGLFADEYDDDEDDKLGNARYEDFFGGKDRKPSKRKSRASSYSDGCGSDDETGKILSTHEKERKRLKSKIEQMEQDNLGVKDWTMQGEVSAAKRPKNSALEADLQFEHNVTRQPMTTEESTASLEDLITSRILEGQFDSLQKPAGLPTKAPRKVKEMDENKSKKGLAEIYEEDYVQKTNVDYVASSFDDEAKKETTALWKRLCLKLDALSHFHYTPKPIIEDMLLPENVPALTMEEVAPMLVSDAAMLAPQELFAGKGDIKDETELTKAERKMRRANKKKKFKAEKEKRTANKPRESKLKYKDDGEIAK